MNIRHFFPAVILLLIPPMMVLAQQPQSTQQMMEEAKKQIAEDQDMDPADRARLLKMMNSKAITDKTKWMDAHPAAMQKAALQEEKMTSLPRPDPKRLSMLPAAVLSTTQMDQFLAAMDTKLLSQLSDADKANVLQVIHVNENNSKKLSSLSVVAWYNGNPEEGLLLAIRAARLQKDSLSLNNLGAFLNEAGHEEKAVPVLRYGLVKSPANPSLLNNLGRAYLGLGDQKKAKQQFLMCVAQAPDHPEANNSLGCLYEGEGNKQEAVSHFEKSIRGAYNENAYEHLSRLQPDADIIKLMKGHYKAPAYFNQFSVQAPPECRDVKAQKQLEQQHDAFQRAMDELIGKYGEMENAADQSSTQTMTRFQHTIINSLSEGKPVRVSVSPFIKTATMMIQKIMKKYTDDTAKARRDYDRSIHDLLNDYGNDAKKLGAEYDAQKKMGPMGECGICCLNCDEVNRRACKALEQLANSYQQQAADLHTTFRQRYHRILLDHFDDMLYWHCLAAVNSYDMQANFYQTVEAFLDEMKYLSETTPFVPYSDCNHDQYPAGNAAQPDLAADKKASCPLSIDIGFVVGKISLDCTSFSISGGELIKGSYKKDFTNGQTTLSIGTGLSANIGTSGMGANASVGESIYMTFDGNGNPTDIGLKITAGVGMNVGAINTGADVTTTVSVNSGWDFTPSGFNNSISL